MGAGPPPLLPPPTPPVPPPPPPPQVAHTGDTENSPIKMTASARESCIFIGRLPFVIQASWSESYSTLAVLCAGASELHETAALRYFYTSITHLDLDSS